MVRIEIKILRTNLNASYAVLLYQISLGKIKSDLAGGRWMTLLKLHHLQTDTNTVRRKTVIIDCAGSLSLPH